MDPYQIAPVLKRIVAKAKGVSDILFSAGHVPRMIKNGSLQATPLKDMAPLTSYQMEIMALHLLKGKPMALQALLEQGSARISHEVEGIGVFRINLMRQRGSFAVACRYVSRQMPTLESLGLTKNMVGVFDRPGLILVCGHNDSGRSSTIAALVNELKNITPSHIITIEDPVEYRFSVSSAMVYQIEIGQDVRDFETGLGMAYNQGGSVLMISNLDHPGLLEKAVEATEAGFLVIGALTCFKSEAALNRLLRLHPDSESWQRRLADCLRCVISQELLPRSDGRGRVAVFEILRNEPMLREILRKGHISKGSLDRLFNEYADKGMRFFRFELNRLVKGGHVPEDVAAGLLDRLNEAPTLPPKKPKDARQRVLELDDSVALEVSD